MDSSSSDSTEIKPNGYFYTFLKSTAFQMLLHAAGILLCLIVYGVLQERIMTREYGDEKIYFRSSAFLVLNNRFFAVLIAIIMLKWRRESFESKAPITKFAAVSVSNTIATYCQYEALKYVSFPTQTLGKCGKTIPVIILGMLIGGKKYNWKDFVVAILVTLGCLSFVLTGNIANKKGSTTEDSTFGLMLMGVYLFSDGFTSVLQEKLFRGYEMSTYNQMLYVNMWSGLFSLSKVVIDGELFESLEFMFLFPEFLFDSVLLSMASTCGQLVILFTIKNFGALFFATVMTLRQIISIILSCLIFMHPLTLRQWLSAGLVFGVLFYKDALMKKTSHHHAPPPSAEDKLGKQVEVLTMSEKEEQGTKA